MNKKMREIEHICDEVEHEKSKKEERKEKKIQEMHLLLFELERRKKPQKEFMNRVSSLYRLVTQTIA